MRESSCSICALTSGDSPSGQRRRTPSSVHPAQVLPRGKSGGNELFGGTRNAARRARNGTAKRSRHFLPAGREDRSGRAAGGSAGGTPRWRESRTRAPTPGSRDGSREEYRRGGGAPSRASAPRPSPPGGRPSCPARCRRAARTTGVVRPVVQRHRQPKALREAFGEPGGTGPGARDEQCETAFQPFVQVLGLQPVSALLRVAAGPGDEPRQSSVGRAVGGDQDHPSRGIERDLRPDDQREPRLPRRPMRPGPRPPGSTRR